MKKTLNIAMVAHDTRKVDLLGWVEYNVGSLEGHTIYATGTTGKMIQESFPSLTVTPLKSGPLGGDQQIGAMIAEDILDMLIFFWDPMTPQPHEPDVRALLRLAVLKNITIAENRNSADHIISSSLFGNPRYKPVKKDYTQYLKREIR